MTMPEFDFEGRAHSEPAANPGAVAAVSAALGIELPEGYLTLLRLSNGGGGPLGVEPSWFQLWPADEALASNRGYEVHEYQPGLFGFGLNGEGELLAIRCATGSALASRHGAIDRHGGNGRGRDRGGLRGVLAGHRT